MSSRIWTFSFLFWLLGLSSWITITGLFQELSLIVTSSGAGFEIWSHFALIIQLANIGPLIYSFVPRNYKTQRFVIICGYTIFALSCSSMLIMSLFWHVHTEIFGQKRLLILYITTFGTALCDCMTSIIYWVFVSYYPTQYMAMLSAGESSSGIICAILIYIQQLNRPDDSPRYSVHVYLFIISMLLPLSAIAFTLLIRFLNQGFFDNAPDWISTDRQISASATKSLPLSHDGTEPLSPINDQSLFKHNHSSNTDLMEMEMVQSNLSFSTNKMNQYSSMRPAQPLLTEPAEEDTENDNIKSNITLNTNQMNIIKEHMHQPSSYRVMSKSRLMTAIHSEASTGVTQNINNIILKNVTAGYWHWIAVVAVLSAIQNGMLPAILSFSLLPYGNIAYILSVTMANILMPISAVLPAMFPTYFIHAKFISVSSIGWISTASYLLMVALQSPTPFGVSRDDGSKPVEFWRVLVIVMFVSCQQLLTLCKTCIFLLIKKSFMLKSSYLDEETFKTGLSKLMEITGVSVQIGSFCGAVLFFLLVNVAHMFKQ